MKALAYDAVLALPERLGLGRLRAALLGELGGRVLEIGAGTGANAPHLRSARLLVQTDPDFRLLRRARQRGPGGRARRAYVRAVAEALPFCDRAFDAAFATFVLCSVQDPTRSLREMARVTRPGGRLVLLEHVRAPQPLVAAAQRAVTPAWSRVADGCHLDRDPFPELVPAGWIPTARQSRLRGLLAVIAARRPGETRAAIEHEAGAPSEGGPPAHR